MSDTQVNALLDALDALRYATALGPKADMPVQRRVAESEAPFSADDMRIVEEIRRQIPLALEWTQLRPELATHCIDSLDGAEVADMIAFYRTRRGQRPVGRVWVSHSANTTNPPRLWYGTSSCSASSR